ncbi:MAG TPA: SCO family protein [Gemmatimonadaceae bacterium]|nr:SCO family protein [Gemmatimonadaceae bacterium]
MRILRTSVLVLSVAALSAATACETRESEIGALRGVRYVPARGKVDFTLYDTQGRPFDFVQQTRGTATLLYFGYTNCPDVCPMHMNNIAAAMKKLSPEDQGRVRVVFVTTDPNRDTPERLRSWLDNFDKRFIGLRGPLDSVNAIAHNLGLPAASMEIMKPGEAGPMNYGMGHAAQVLAYSSDDSLRTEYPGGFTVDDWTNDLPRLIKIR